MHSMFGRKRILSCNDTTFFLDFFSFFWFCSTTFSTLVTSSNLRNQAPLFIELNVLQETCRKSLHMVQCRYTRQWSNWWWDWQMPEIQWPSWQLLLLSTSCNQNHWCVWKVHCPILELSCRETRWHFGRHQGGIGSVSGSTSACLWPWSEGTPPAYWPVCKFILILAALSALTSVPAHYLPNASHQWIAIAFRMCVFCELYCLQYVFYALCKSPVQYCFAPLFSHPD